MQKKIKKYEKKKIEKKLKNYNKIKGIINANTKQRRKKEKRKIDLREIQKY